MRMDEIGGIIPWIDISETPYNLSSLVFDVHVMSYVLDLYLNIGWCRH